MRIDISVSSVLELSKHEYITWRYIGVIGSTKSFRNINCVRKIQYNPATGVAVSLIWLPMWEGPSTGSQMKLVEAAPPHEKEPIEAICCDSWGSITTENPSPNPTPACTDSL